MKNCNIHFLPAKAGDCFVLEFSNRECIIIDCGFKSTYKKELRPLLIELQKKGCKVILLIITHTDQDHIEGAIAFLQENGKANNPNIIQVENIWFNGFFNTLLRRSEFMDRVRGLTDIQKREKERVLKEFLLQIPGEEGEISAIQSTSFEELCLNNGYSLNTQFTDKVVKRIENKKKQILKHTIDIGACQVIVLSPTEKELDKLADKLNLEMIRNFGVDYSMNQDSQFMKLLELLMELERENMDGNEEIAAMGDCLESWIGTSTMAPVNEINRASIVVEIIYNDLRLLFTGDSDSILWSQYLEKNYHVIKLSHHGTASPNQKLLDSTHGDILMVSSDGGYNKRHPEDEMLAKAILKGNKKLYFNYEIRQKEKLEKLQKAYGFQCFFGKRKIEL